MQTDAFVCAPTLHTYVQVLLDRLAHADVLEWAWWLNSHWRTTFQHMHGDKDSWRLAFGLANKTHAYRQVSMPPRDALSYANGSRTPFKHAGMVQHTPDARPAFLHRTGDRGCSCGCRTRALLRRQLLLHAPKMLLPLLPNRHGQVLPALC